MPSDFQSESDDVDQTLSLVVDVLALLGASGVAALLSPEVESAASAGWFAVFLATLALSLSVAITAFAGMRGVVGYPLLFVGVLALAGSNWLAWNLGTGYLDLPPVSGNGFVYLLNGLAIAMQTYGFVGTVLGAGVGVWLGYRATKLFPVDG